jgi:hypothetical protein
MVNTIHYNSNGEYRNNKIILKRNAIKKPGLRTETSLLVKVLELFLKCQILVLTYKQKL